MKKPDLYIDSASVKIAVYTWGRKPTIDQPKEVLIFAHGFPDRALFWEKVAKQLEHDFYVVAFDQRGCGESSHIRGMKHYKFELLVDDLFAVINAVSPNQKVHLIGHDWGGIYGWDAIKEDLGQKKIASFITMSPSLDQIGFYLRKRLLKPTPKNLYQVIAQLFRNSLMTFFTLPILPELVWYSGLGLLMMRIMVKHFENIPLQVFAGVEGDAIRYLGIYRANMLQRVFSPQQYTVDVPVHLLLASGDPFLPPHLFEQTNQWANQLTESTVDAAHWAPASRPVEMAEDIRQFIRSLVPTQIGLKTRANELLGKANIN
ncbi:alpha/beta fold hydrolase [Acinetobacter sp. AYS6]|uniref:alpha/beta fold hydrolase n=1 Tax=Acinetobacter sp. AYS6 TaxID=2983297 RepID=UPI0021D68927|nr:alpha/beta fold hydrolase [Acinetobacter sp. AYS6]MCU7696967.1 alpha/beta fold hydrolase [Acinetobacter sp. AYS6]